MAILFQNSRPAGVQIPQNWIFGAQPGLGNYNGFPEANERERKIFQVNRTISHVNQLNGLTAESYNSHLNEVYPTLIFNWF